MCHDINLNYSQIFPVSGVLWPLQVKQERRRSSDHESVLVWGLVHYDAALQEHASRDIPLSYPRPRIKVGVLVKIVLFPVHT